MLWVPIGEARRENNKEDIILQLVKYSIEDFWKEVEDIAVMVIEDEEVKCIDFQDK